MSRIQMLTESEAWHLEHRGVMPSGRSPRFLNKKKAIEAVSSKKARFVERHGMRIEGVVAMIPSSGQPEFEVPDGMWRIQASGGGGVKTLQWVKKFQDLGVCK